MIYTQNFENLQDSSIKINATICDPHANQCQDLTNGLATKRVNLFLKQVLSFFTINSYNLCKMHFIIIFTDVKMI